MEWGGAVARVSDRKGGRTEVGRAGCRGDARASQDSTPKHNTLAAAPHAARSHLRMKAAPQTAACSSCRVSGAGDGRRAGEPQDARAHYEIHLALTLNLPPPFQRRKSRPPQLTCARTRKTTSKVSMAC